MACSSAIGAPTNLVPRDAVAGTGPAVLTLPSGLKVGVVISWEVFFGGRANEGVVHGGTMILNPTNGSSYTWTVLQSQQIASSRLRAVEQGRWVAQAAPTGFSAFVAPDGEVHDRTAISEQAVISRTVTTATARTWYSHLGTIPIVVARGRVVNVLAPSRGRTGRGGHRRRRAPDADVIAASLDRPAAFGTIFDRHATVLHRYLVRRLGPDDAEAIIGEVFRIAFERRATFDPERAGDGARPWLYGIATNLLAKHRRREARRLHAVARLAADRGAAARPGRRRRRRGRRRAALAAGRRGARPRCPQAERDALVLARRGRASSYDDIAARARRPASARCAPACNRARRSANSGAS